MNVFCLIFSTRCFRMPDRIDVTIKFTVQVQTSYLQRWLSWFLLPACVSRPAEAPLHLEIPLVIEKIYYFCD